MEEVVWPGTKRAAVSLTFDDGRPSNVVHGLPVLDQYAIRATFYVVPRNIDEFLGHWQAASHRGHEIGNHTLTHPCSGNFQFSRGNALEDKCLDDLVGELDGANDALKQAFGQTPTTFAYPCYQTFVGRGGSRRSYVPLVAQRFRVGRTGPAEVANDPLRCDLHAVGGTVIDGIPWEAVRALIERAKEESRWLILVGHDTAPAPIRQGVSDVVLHSLCTYLADSDDLWCAPVAEVGEWIFQQQVGTP